MKKTEPIDVLCERCHAQTKGKTVVKIKKGTAIYFGTWCKACAKRIKKSPHW